MINHITESTPMSALNFFLWRKENPAHAVYPAFLENNQQILTGYHMQNEKYFLFVEAGKRFAPRKVTMALYDAQVRVEPLPRHTEYVYRVNFKSYDTGRGNVLEGSVTLASPLLPSNIIAVVNMTHEGGRIMLPPVSLTDENQLAPFFTLIEKANLLRTEWLLCYNCQGTGGVESNELTCPICGGTGKYFQRNSRKQVTHE